MALPLGSCGAPSAEGEDGGATLENVESVGQELNLPVLGTIDMRPAAIGVHQSGAMGQFLGGWNLNYLDTVPGLVGDFDADGLDDFVIRSAWGVGMIGNDASDNLRATSMGAYGTWGSWNLSPNDRLAAVARLGTENHASVIIQGASGLGVMRPGPGGFAIDTFANGTRISGSWLLGVNDKVLGAGPLGTTGDAFIIASPWGLGIFDRQSGTTLRVVNMWGNGTTVGSWVLDTNDPSFRLLGIGNFDGLGRPEFMLQTRQGMALLSTDSANNLVMTAWVDYNGSFASATYGTGTSYPITPRDAFIAFKDLNADGKDDLLFQTLQGVVALKYSGSPTAPFSVLASHRYGVAIGGWSFGKDDRLIPIVNDFDGNGQNDFTIGSGSWLGNLTVSGSDFTSVAQEGWSNLSLANERTVVASGRFDHRVAKEYLFKNPKTTLFTTRTAVTTQHNDNNRTGAYLNETTLTPSQVQSRGMKLALTYTMDAASDSQPLYVPDLVVNGVTKDVVIATDVNANIYMFDANATTGGLLAKWTMADPENPSGRPIRPGGFGITGTPVVDMANELLYVLFQTSNGGESTCWDPNRDVAFWLAAIDLHTGAMRRSVRINATYPSTLGAFTFQPNPACTAMSVPAGRSDFISQNQNSRSAMLLDHGKIYVTFGMRHQEENRYYKGWVMRYDAETFEQQGVFNVAPNNSGYDGGGIWGGGAGMAADPVGNVYVMTGNGPVNPGARSYGDSFLKLAPRGKTLQLVASFSPCDASLWQAHDVDLGSGGVLLVPGTDRLIGGGKSGEFNLLVHNQLDVGVNCGSTLGAPQSFQAFINSNVTPAPDPSTYDTIGWEGGPHLHGSPTYWRSANAGFGYVYHWAEKDYARQFRFNVSTGLLEPNSVVRATQGAQFPTNVVLSPNTMSAGGGSVMPGGMMSLSANGTTAGSAILWSVSHWCNDFNNCNPIMDRLSAIHAETMALLWTSTVNNAVIPNWQMAHWGPPLIADGKVFVATGNGRMMKFTLN